MSSSDRFKSAEFSYSEYKNSDRRSDVFLNKLHTDSDKFSSKYSDSKYSDSKYSDSKYSSSNYSEDLYKIIIKQIKCYIDGDIKKYSFEIDKMDGGIIIIKKYNKNVCKININSFSTSDIFEQRERWVHYLKRKISNIIDNVCYPKPQYNYIERPIYNSTSDNCPKYKSPCCNQYDPCCDNQTGATGPTGPRGLQGPMGPPGMNGSTGVPGATGNQGTQGCQGPIGPVGPQGEIGPTGLMGPTGIKGKKGPTGCRGKRGYTGAKGDTGPKGPQGIEGRRGKDGCDGCPGCPGPTGPRGFCGHSGPMGPTGFTGPIGIMGATGPTGVIGPTGPQGLIGVQGPQGIRGLIGPTGPQATVTITNVNGNPILLDNNIQLSNTLQYNNSLTVPILESISPGNSLNNITNIHNKGIIASSNSNLQGAANNNTVIMASNDGTISGNNSINVVLGTNNFSIDGTGINNGIVASKGTKISNSTSSSIIGSDNGLLNTNEFSVLSNCNGCAIIGSDRNNKIQKSVLSPNNNPIIGCSITSSNNSTIEQLNSSSSVSLVGCGGQLDLSTVNIQDGNAVLGAGLVNTSMTNINNSGIIANNNINCNNLNTDMVLAVSNGNIDMNGINNSVLISSTLNGASVSPRTSNTLNGANITGLKWEINSENGNIVNEGTISSTTPISGLSKMMENNSIGVIQSGILLRIVSGNKVRICNDNEIPHLVSRPFDSCAYITNNSDFKWDKTMVRDEWGSIVYHNIVDTSFENQKITYQNELIKVNNIVNNLSNQRSVVINNINIINAKATKTEDDLLNLNNLYSSLINIDNELKYYQNKYSLINNWLTNNQNITKLISVPKINPDLNSNIINTYLPRNKRPEEWTACEWTGLAPVIVDSTVLVENYVTSGPNGIGKISVNPTRIYCTQILDLNNNYTEITPLTQSYLNSGYKIALCAIGNF